MTDVAALAQKAAEERLWAIADAEQLLDDGVEVEDYPGCGPWDGCDTCVVREVLDAAWPVVLENFAGFLQAGGHASAAAALLSEYGL